MVLILDLGADPNEADESGDAPLIKAVAGGHKAVAALLLERGADPNKANENKWTPLHEAADKDNGFVAALLHEKGAGLNTADGIGMRPLDMVWRTTRPWLRCLTEGAPK